MNRRRPARAGAAHAQDRPSLAGGRVTAVRPVRSKPEWSWVSVDGRRAARVETAALGSLGIAVGATWTASMESAARAAEARSAAKSYALKAIAHRPLSVAELLAKLGARGHDAATSAAVAADLQRVGLLDDERFARDYIRAQLARKPAGRALLLAGLRRRRVEDPVARRAVDEALGEVDLSGGARQLAASRLRRMDPRLEPEVLRRRLFGLLARRGFDPETARDAVDRAMKAAGKGRRSWEHED